MALVQGKAYRPNFGEPWEMLPPEDAHPCYRLVDREGRERVRTLPRSGIVTRRGPDGRHTIVVWATRQRHPAPAY